MHVKESTENKEMNVATGVVHEIPEDLKEALISNSGLLTKWNSLTPLQRNEWICWVTSVKMLETRKNHIKRLSDEILDGKRRPCCWPGCPHRSSNVKTIR